MIVPANPSIRSDALTSDHERELEALLITVAVHHGIRVDEMKCSIRTWDFVRARRDFALRAQARGYSLSVIGRCLGGRHHTTILSLTRKSDVSV